MVGALEVPNFRLYVSGQSLSLIGTWVETVAQGLLVLKLTHSGIVLGLTTASRYGPVLVLSPYAGLLVDRLSKRCILLITQAGLAVVSLLLGLAVLSGSVRLWQVFVLAVAFGTFSAADNPARQSFVSEMVGPSLLRNAVTLNSTLVNLARVLGPTVAAVVVDSIGIGWCFIVNAVSFLFVIASLLALNTKKLYVTPPPHRAPRQLRDGFRYAASVPDIIVPLLMMAVVGTFAFEFEVSLPLLGEDTFHGGADAYSWLLGSFGAGAVIGGLYAADKARTGVVRLTRVAAAYAVAMGLLAAMPDLWSAVAASTLVGVSAILFLTSGNATVQLASDPHFRGRVMALWSMALVGTTPIGAPIVGALSAAFNPRAGIAIGAVGCAVAAGIGRWAPSRSSPAGGRALQASNGKTEFVGADLTHTATRWLPGFNVNLGR